MLLLAIMGMIVTIGLAGVVGFMLYTLYKFITE